MKFYSNIGTSYNENNQIILPIGIVSRYIVSLLKTITYFMFVTSIFSTPFYAKSVKFFLTRIDS